jgi:hypothetical protein
MFYCNLSSFICFVTACMIAGSLLSLKGFLCGDYYQIVWTCVRDTNDRYIYVLSIVLCDDDVTIVTFSSSRFFILFNQVQCAFLVIYFMLLTEKVKINGFNISAGKYR